MQGLLGWMKFCPATVFGRTVGVCTLHSVEVSVLAVYKRHACISSVIIGTNHEVF